MKQPSILLTFAATFALSGCSISSWYPKQFDQVTEVYPSAAEPSLLAAAPAPSKTMAMFSAPYYDVFAIAVRSVSQNQWNLISQDLTTRVTGTTYRTSNPAIATVSDDGLVTALRSGTVAISTSNNGIVGTIMITANIGDDTDNDGLPDQYELDNGLDPNDPTDAGLDQDGDGLTALEEFGIGTLPQVEDTDGDGQFSVSDIAACENRSVAVVATMDTPVGRIWGRSSRVQTAAGTALDIGDLVLSPVLRVPGSPMFAAEQRFPAGGSPFSAGVADFNADSIPDLIAANAAEFVQTATLTNGDGAPDYDRIDRTEVVQASDVAVGDFDNDGITDIVSASTSFATINAYLGNGDGTLAAPTETRLVGGAPVRVITTDLNSDGVPDLVVANQSTMDWSVYLAMSAPDTDADGIPDQWETDTGTDPNDPSDAGGDVNGNGVSNLDEYRLAVDL